jgi:hypothetical protein
MDGRQTVPSSSQIQNLNSFMMFARTAVVRCVRSFACMVEAENYRWTSRSTRIDLAINVARRVFRTYTVFWRTPSQLVKFLFRVRD